MARSVDRWICRSLDRWICRSLDRQIARSLDLQIVRSVDRWICRSLDRCFTPPPSPSASSLSLSPRLQERVKRPGEQFSRHLENGVDDCSLFSTSSFHFLYIFGEYREGKQRIHSITDRELRQCCYMLVTAGGSFPTCSTHTDKSWEHSSGFFGSRRVIVGSVDTFSWCFLAVPFLLRPISPGPSHSVERCESAHDQPWFIYGLRSDVVLVSRVYLCKNKHQTLAHDPGIIFQIPRDFHPPFVLFQKSGVTRKLFQYFIAHIRAGMTIEDVQVLWQQSLIDEYGTRKVSYIRKTGEKEFPMFAYKGRKVGERS